MTYQRKIAYLDYWEYGDKKGSRGFCKWEQKEDIHKLEISISGLEMPKSSVLKVVSRSGMELGKVPINNGRAAVVFLKETEKGNWEWEFTQIKIHLDEDRELFAEFETEPLKMDIEEKVKTEVLKRTIEDEEKQVKTLREDIGEEIRIGMSEESRLKKKDVVVEMEENLAVEDVEKEDQDESEEWKTEGISSDELPLLSLWDCLIKEHKILRPFGTKEEYCRIVLEDIFLLEGRFHILKNNPFLLHGYYNYKYLILGKKNDESREYWLGVPGIYHEREKVAAKMYGFEKFEGAKPRYGTGDLGYYLITVR